MPVIVHHDKETYSEADLKAIGAYAYARHSTTDCLLTSGFVAGERTIRRWRPGNPCPYDDIHPDDIEVHAWNSQFERQIWWNVMVPRYGWPRLELEQFVCVSAQARIYGAGPQKLDVAGRFFNRRHKKDNRGHQHMLKMCRPASEKEQLAWIQNLERQNRKDPRYRILQEMADRDQAQWEDAKRCHHTRANIDKLHDYCDQDVRTETDVSDMLPPWHPADLADFHANERINDHGIVVDVDFARAATAYAEDEKRYFAAEIVRITGGAVETPRQFQRIKEWALPRLSEEARAVAKWYDEGVEKYSFDADTRANLLSEAASDLDWIAADPDDAEELVEFVELLDAAGKSTISKYQAIANRAVQDADGNWRVHGAFVFAGASQSHRFSSTGTQMHNMVRAVPDNAIKLITAFKRNKGVLAEVERWRKGAQPLHALGQLVRPTITGCPADIFDLVWGDWSSIEACANPWLSLEKSAEPRLEALRRGEDIYLKTASAILKRTVTKEDKDERQAYGKVPELSLGYLGGNGAFKSMAKNLGVRLPEKEITRIVRDWRDDNPWAMNFGLACEKAAMAALRRSDGTSYSAGRLEYYADPDRLDGIGALICILPNGSELVYPAARIQIVRTSWGEEKLGITAMKSAWLPKKDAPWEHWPRVSLWPGLLIENATQAICAKLLKLGLERAAAAGLTVCAHTHDEIMIETPAPERDALVLHSLMTKRPSWSGADALPLRAEVECGYRYKVKFKEAA